MNNEQSYTEMMKATSKNKQAATDTFMLELYVDMILQEALLKAQKEKLLQKIDDALDHRDHTLFSTYCQELIQLNKKFGA
ncbi:IDEAL domain-containing protein [Bacillus testis]|uniref:IDEAL domain-containing protein n=1 Tax=Bacillus testis TaxID=1622072 RepID=UPI00067EE531|nr:IDEAL domain-containing protein [Bacillus testis]